MLPNVIDPAEAPRLEFADALVMAWPKLNSTSQAHIMAAARDLAAAKGSDPFASTVTITVAIQSLLENLSSAGFDQAKLQLVEAVLHCAFRLPSDDIRKIIEAVRALAEMRGDDVFTAEILARDIMDYGRTHAQVAEASF